MAGSEIRNESPAPHDSEIVSSWRRNMKCRSIDNGIALSAPCLAHVLLCSVLALSACGTADHAPPVAEEHVDAATAPLAVTDPATPLAVTLPPAADPLTAGLVVPADAP